MNRWGWDKFVVERVDIWLCCCHLFHPTCPVWCSICSLVSQRRTWCSAILSPDSSVHSLCLWWIVVFQIPAESGSESCCSTDRFPHQSFKWSLDTQWSKGTFCVGSHCSFWYCSLPSHLGRYSPLGGYLLTHMVNMKLRCRKRLVMFGFIRDAINPAVLDEGRVKLKSSKMYFQHHGTTFTLHSQNTIKTLRNNYLHYIVQLWDLH